MNRSCPGSSWSLNFAGQVQAEDTNSEIIVYTVEEAMMETEYRKGYSEAKGGGSGVKCWRKID